MRDIEEHFNLDMVRIGIMSAFSERMSDTYSPYSAFPREDTEDFSRGARFIPGEVTLLRRERKPVRFVQECGNPCCWYWECQDLQGNIVRIYHWDPYAFERIGEQNGRYMMETRHGRAFYDAQGQKCEDGPGPCPHCGNRHVFGSGEEIFIAKTVEERAIEFLIERAESAVIERIVWEDIEYSY